MASIPLPFTLPFDLSVTQYHGESGSHKTNLAIDLAPIGLDFNKKSDFYKYLLGYLKLIEYMRFGWLRINAYKNCWHYHYEAIKGVNWAGSEVYGYNPKTGRCEKIYGTTIRKINLGEYGSTTELAQMAASLRDIYGSKAADIFTGDFWEEFRISITGDTFRPASVVYDENMISTERLESLMAGFSENFAAGIMTRILPGSYSAQEEFFDEVKGLLTVGIGIGAALLFLNMVKTAREAVGEPRRV